MKRIVALDCGDTWVGVAHSDPNQILYTPFAVWQAKKLEFHLAEYLKTHNVECVVIGIPYTMNGGESDQTRKIKNLFQHLQSIFPNTLFKTQDERLSSRFAASTCAPLKQSKCFLQKDRMEHARAAAIILEQYIHAQKRLQEENQTY